MALASPVRSTNTEFQEIVGNYLSYWLSYFQTAQPSPKVSDELESLKATIKFGQRKEVTSRMATGLLILVFPYLLPHPDRDWLRLYEIAIRQLPKDSPKQALLHYQHACLRWQLGFFRAAVVSFLKSSQFAKNKRLLLQARTGLALSFWSLQDYKRAQVHANRLHHLASRRARYGQLNNQTHLLLGLLSFSSKQYAQALDHFRNIPIAATSNELKAQLFLRIGLCFQAMGNLKPALFEYNQAARAAHLTSENTQELARIEILRASVHLQNRKTQPPFRLKSATAALARASDALNDSLAMRAILENFMGRVYARSGNIERGLAYLNSALGLSQQAEDRSLFADTFGAIATIEKKAR